MHEERAYGDLRYIWLELLRYTQEKGTHSLCCGEALGVREATGKVLQGKLAAHHCMNLRKKPPFTRVALSIDFGFIGPKPAFKRAALVVSFDRSMSPSWA